MPPTAKLTAYALNVCAFALGAWIAASALDPAEASPGASPPATGAEGAAAVPTTVDYGPHIARR